MSISIYNLPIKSFVTKQSVGPIGKAANFENRRTEKMSMTFRSENLTANIAGLSAAALMGTWV